MKQEIKLEVPKDWSGITLKQYLALRKDMEAYKDNEEAVFACILHHICGFPAQYIEQMDIDTYLAIKKDIASFIGKVEHPLQRFITIDGVEYGFEPNLSQMAYGAYVDISKYETLEMNEKWAEIMSILYRPVVSKSGALYDIKKYDGTIDTDKFMNVTMDKHWGALFFFKHLLTDLQNYTLKSLKKEYPELHHNIKSILQRNGNPTLPLFNWQEEIFSK